MKTRNLSADNFKKILVLDESTPEPAILSSDTGQRIPCFESCQLITTCVQHQCSCAPKLARKCEIEHWFPCGADGRAGCGRCTVYGHVITKFSGMGRFTYPWCSAGALRAPELRYHLVGFETRFLFINPLLEHERANGSYNITNHRQRKR